MFSSVDCGASGLYGRNQKHWYLTEEGLKFNDSRLTEDPKVRTNVLHFDLLLSSFLTVDLFFTQHPRTAVKVGGLYRVHCHGTDS